MSYYSDLSADDSSTGEDEGFESDEGSWGAALDNQQALLSIDDDAAVQQWKNCILHVDIDCFYCQCEHLDRNLPPSRPIAIGQKNIIVTSNYAARQFGVKKLQLREDACKACPNLLIVEGSDLERYRKHSRKVYDAFRDCIQNCLAQPSNGKVPPVRRGRGFDELQADLTCLVECFDGSALRRASGQNYASISTYGEQKETTTLTEDQTGAQAIVRPYDMSLDRQVSNCGSYNAREECQQRLLAAATELGHIIQQTILERTGLTTTLGISVNPLLAKLASDLQKPKSINVLYPWRAPQLISDMPLRKIPDAGHKTIKLLKPALEKFHGPIGTGSFWTCRCVQLHS